LKNCVSYRKLAEEEYNEIVYLKYPSEMKESSKPKKANKNSKAIVQKINKSENNRAAAQLVETGSKLDQSISCDEQQDLQKSENSKKNQELWSLIIEDEEDDEDNDLKEFISSNKNLNGAELEKFNNEYNEREEKRDKKFNDWIEPVLKKHVILENILASHRKSNMQEHVKKEHGSLDNFK
jgi:hypothetical protein